MNEFDNITSSNMSLQSNGIGFSLPPSPPLASPQVENLYRRFVLTGGNEVPDQWDHPAPCEFPPNSFHKPLNDYASLMNPLDTNSSFVSSLHAENISRVPLLDHNNQVSSDRDGGMSSLV
jgi:hypothetical protein